MRKDITEKLSRISREEEELLLGGELEKEKYSYPGDFIISDLVLHGKGEISVRPHTRFTLFPEHKHNYMEMMITLSGTLTHVIDGKRIELSAGDILFLNKHISHSVLRAERDDLGVNVIISDSFLESIADELSGTVFSGFIKQNSLPLGEGMYLHFSTNGESALNNLVENLLSELFRENGADRFIMSRTVSLLLIYLSRESEDRLLAATELPDKDAKRVMEISSYLKNHYRDGSLYELSRQLYLSVPYLSKLIRKKTGKSFKELMLNERIARAEKLITETDMQIGEIISAVGYENESYFHREYRKKTGESPLATRKKARRKATEGQTV